MLLHDNFFRKKRIGKQSPGGILESVGNWGINLWTQTIETLCFIRLVFASLGRLIRGKVLFRPVDLWWELDKAGVRAIPIVCLISFMIGLIIAFVGNMQLKLFGAEIYVAALVAISMIRILGAIMTGIIMAGRTGASYAAEIASMHLNDETDALKTMGISPIDFLVLPRVLALTITMPVLTILSDIVAIFGGMFVASLIMNVSIMEYWQTTMDWLSFNNFAIGVLHGWLFGWVIAITGCWCGIKSSRTANGVGRAATRAVVNGIIGCIVTTAILTIVFNWLDI
ncbi:MAG: ABC transporter permease [Alphaproteobacteria bacterium]|nr:ABC transporter permease [Alphaproteobacteria bacterium]